jgi:hypothetical protein
MVERIAYFDFCVHRGEVGRLAANGATVLLLHPLPSANNHGFGSFKLRHGNLIKTVCHKREL